MSIPRSKPSTPSRIPSPTKLHFSLSPNSVDEPLESIATSYIPLRSTRLSTSPLKVTRNQPPSSPLGSSYITLQRGWTPKPVTNTLFYTPTKLPNFRNVPAEYLEVLGGTPGRDDYSMYFEANESIDLGEDAATDILESVERAPSSSTERGASDVGGGRVLHLSASLTQSKEIQRSDSGMELVTETPSCLSKLDEREVHDSVISSTLAGETLEDVAERVALWSIEEAVKELAEEGNYYMFQTEEDIEMAVADTWETMVSKVQNTDLSLPLATAVADACTDQPEFSLIQIREMLQYDGVNMTDRRFHGHLEAIAEVVETPLTVWNDLSQVLDLAWEVDEACEEVHSYFDLARSLKTDLGLYFQRLPVVYTILFFVGRLFRLYPERCTSNAYDALTHLLNLNFGRGAVHDMVPLMDAWMTCLRDYACLPSAGVCAAAFLKSSISAPISDSLKRVLLNIIESHAQMYPQLVTQEVKKTVAVSLSPINYNFDIKTKH